MKETLNTLYNQLVMLCEVRWSLDLVSNQETESRIIEIKEKILKLEGII